MKPFKSRQAIIRSTATALGIVLAASGSIALAGGSSAEKLAASFLRLFSEPIGCFRVLPEVTTLPAV